MNKNHEYTIVKKTIEQGYFHSSNSGITYNVIEITKDYPNYYDNKPRKIVDYKFEITHGAFGESSTFSTPIAIPEMSGYLKNMFERVENYMKNNPNYKSDGPFKNNFNELHTVKILNGLKQEQIIETKRVDEVSTTTHVIGLNFINQETNEIVDKIMFETPFYKSSCESKRQTD